MASLIPACCCNRVSCNCGNIFDPDNVVRDSLPSAVHVEVTINVCLYPWDGSNNSTCTISGTATRDPSGCTFVLNVSAATCEAIIPGCTFHLSLIANVSSIGACTRTCAYTMAIGTGSPGCIFKPTLCAAQGWNAAKAEGTGFDPYGEYVSCNDGFSDGQIVSAVVS